MVGVAPEAKCISVKALAKNGSGSYLGLAQALDYAIEMKPDLVSMSLGGPSPSPALQKRIKTLYDMNIPVVCAAEIQEMEELIIRLRLMKQLPLRNYDKYGNVARFSSKGEKVEWAALFGGQYL